MSPFVIGPIRLVISHQRLFPLLATLALAANCSERLPPTGDLSRRSDTQVQRKDAGIGSDTSTRPADGARLSDGPTLSDGRTTVDHTGLDAAPAADAHIDSAASRDRGVIVGHDATTARDTQAADQEPPRPDAAQPRQVSCDGNNGNPANSSDSVVMVTVTFDPTTNAWSQPAKCAWSCNPGFCRDQNSCITDKTVRCDPNNGNPANSSDTPADVRITCQANGALSTPAPCAWRCNQGFFPRADGKACVGALYLVSAGAATGAGGDRRSMDKRCIDAVSANYANLGTSRSVGFISISVGDQIRDLPAAAQVPIDRPIFGPTGTRIADNWANLLKGTHSASLSAAGVTSNYWFSGSSATGALASCASWPNTSCKTAHCSNWTAASGPNDGTYGTPTAVDSRWIETHYSGYCGGGYHFLCLTWAP